MQGINVVGVQFRRAGKIYDFAAGDIKCKVGDQVVVDSERGPSLAKVCSVRFHNPNSKLNKKLKPILRKASYKELNRPLRLTPEHVREFTHEKISSLELDMRILDCEIQFGGSKVIIYFTAPGRVDFRELVKELAGGLKSRVELKQVGARDETKLLGGVGICGREYCCSSFLREFVPVSIKMAKNQNLALNPSKVSGGCGRLLCCLTYENEAYTHLRMQMPPRGTLVNLLETSETGKVIKGDLLNQLVVVETNSGQERQCKITEIEILEKNRTHERADSIEDQDSWGEDLDLDELQGHLESQGNARSTQNKNHQRNSEPSSQNRERSPRGGGHRRPSERRRESNSNSQSHSAQQSEHAGKRRDRGHGPDRRSENDQSRRPSSDRRPSKGRSQNQSRNKNRPRNAHPKSK